MTRRVRAIHAELTKWAHATLGVFLALASFSCSTPTGPTPPPPAEIEPPTIACPMSQTVTSSLNVPIVVTYGAPVTMGGKAPVATACSPESGSVFPVGVTPVTCTATDAEQRTSSCSVEIVVAAPPQIAITRFVAFGDSITAGEDGSALTAMGHSLGDADGRLFPFVVLAGREYPTVLQNELRSRYTLQGASIGVRNVGVQSERAGDAATLTRFQREVVGGGHQAVLLMEGANDLRDAYDGSSRAIPDAISNLRSMVRTARGAGIRPYLGTLPPAFRDSPCGPPCRGLAADLVPGFNDQVRGVAAAEGISLVDVYAAFSGDRTLISADGLHPNAAGYERIARAFFESIRATVEIDSAATASASKKRLPSR